MERTMMAPAKVNLFLHVGRVKANGRHALESLVVFAGPDAADTLAVQSAERLGLLVAGPTADAAGAGDDNLVLRAASALKASAGVDAGAQFTLTKRLPVAAGIGGGSADAAAALRLLTQLWRIDPAHAQRVAPTLGGDVPVALGGTAALMRGEGERVTPLRLPGRLPAVLVNPGVPCPTGRIFGAYDAGGGGGEFRETGHAPDVADTEALITWLAACRNDLQAAAIGEVPAIHDVLVALRDQPGVRLARMSGSGATCFGLFGSEAAAAAAASAISLARPDWWVAATLLGDITA